MTVQRSHGQPRAQAPRADEMAVPVPPAGPSTAAPHLGSSDTRFDSESGRMAAGRRWELERFRRAANETLGLARVGDLMTDHVRLGAEHERSMIEDLEALTGETLGPFERGMLRQAALAHMASLFLYEQATTTGDPAVLAEARQQGVAARGHKQSAVDAAGKLQAARHAGERRRAAAAMAKKRAQFQAQLEAPKGTDA